MKKVIAKTDSPIFFKDAEVWWSDIWLQFTSKPARKKVRFAPTFIGLDDLRREVEFSEKIASDYPDDKEFQAELVEQKAALNALKTQEIVITEPYGNKIPNIYINKPTIKRVDAEKMIDAFMKYLGFSGARVKWLKPKFIVIPA